MFPLILSALLVVTQTGDPEGSLQRMRQALRDSRLSALDVLDSGRKVSPQQIELAKETLFNAGRVWTVCLINGVDRAPATSDNAVIDQVMLDCKQDREETRAWFRIFGRANGVELNRAAEAAIEDELRKTDAVHRRRMLERLSAKRR